MTEVNKGGITPTMKTRLRVLLSVILATPLLVFGMAHAVDGTGDTSQSSDSTNNTQNAETNDQQEAADLKTRIEEHKAALKTKLTTLEQRHVQLVCKAAQGKLTSTINRVKGVETSREAIYKALTTHLTDLITKLKAKGADTKALEDEVTVLNTKIATFNTDLATYKQDLNDLGTMTCTTDPTGFKAQLETSRSARLKVLADATTIKAYVKDTIKPTLQTIRQKLGTTNNEGSN